MINTLRGFYHIEVLRDVERLGKGVWVCMGLSGGVCRGVYIGGIYTLIRILFLS